MKKESTKPTLIPDIIGVLLISSINLYRKCFMVLDTTVKFIKQSVFFLEIFFAQISAAIRNFTHRLYDYKVNETSCLKIVLSPEE